MVLGKVGDHVIAQAAIVAGIIPVCDKGITVVAVQSVAAADPHKTATILYDAIYIDLRQPFPGAKVLKLKALLLGKAKAWPNQQYKKDRCLLQ